MSVETKTLLLGDCLDLMNDLPDKSIDLICCDLPYGTTACSWDTIIPFDELWAQYRRIIKDKGTIVLFGSEPFSSALRMSNLDWYNYDWIWEKNNAGNFQLVNHQPLKIHETISIFYNDAPNMQYATILKDNMEQKDLKQIEVSQLQLSKNGGLTGWVSNKLNGSQLPTREQWEKICNLFEIENEYDKILNTIPQRTYNLKTIETNVVCSNKGKAGSLGHLSSENKRETYLQTQTGYPKSILSYDRENGLHPTQKPVDLMKFLISTYSNEGEVVLDNCMGSGSTGVAALELNRKFIGMELDEEYFECAKTRMLTIR